MTCVWPMNISAMLLLHCKDFCFYRCTVEFENMAFDGYYPYRIANFFLMLLHMFLVKYQNIIVSKKKYDYGVRNSTSSRILLLENTLSGTSVSALVDLCQSSSPCVTVSCDERRNLDLVLFFLRAYCWFSYISHPLKMKTLLSLLLNMWCL